MSDSSTNPFVLPGMGQSSDLSGNPLLASMEMMRQAWAGLAGPGGLAQVLPMTPPMNTDELERRIADLRAVESWLRMNLSMLASTIQGMEVQRATIATLRSFVDGMAASMDTGAAPAPGEPTPLEIALGLKPAPRTAGSGGASADRRETSAGAQWPPGQSSGSGAQPSGAQSSGAQPSDAPPASGPAASESLDSAALSASQAWWNLLQQQFSNIAAAAAASMPSMTPPPGEAPADPAARGAARSTASSSPAPGASSAPAAKGPAAAGKAAPSAGKAAASPAAQAAKTAKPAAKSVRKRTAAPRKPAAGKPPADKT